jgi:hypothetical protein
MSLQLQGEAVAFALGGNRKMLRAGSLAGLVNQERRAAGCRTAQVMVQQQMRLCTPANDVRLADIVPQGSKCRQPGWHSQPGAQGCGLQDGTGEDAAV